MVSKQHAIMVNALKATTQQLFTLKIFAFVKLVGVDLIVISLSAIGSVINLVEHVKIPMNVFVL